MKKSINYLSSIMAGICISVGGTIFLACENKIVGSFMFALGLFTICVFGFNLFTGKIGYILNNKNKPNCFIIWLGNLTGCLIGGLLIRLARPDLTKLAITLVNKKLSQEIYQTVIYGLFCGFLMYIAVDNYKNNQDSFGKYIGIFLAVATFILSGFEHSIADMFYFVVGIDTFENLLKGIIYILIVSISNGVSAVLFDLAVRKIKEKKEEVKKDEKV